jgi:riboflavin synthase
LLSRERTGEGCRIRVGTETFAGVVVPRTREVTTLSEKCVGDLIHFEADVLAKYVERQRSLAGSA